VRLGEVFWYLDGLVGFKCVRIFWYLIIFNYFYFLNKIMVKSDKVGKPCN